MESADTVYAQSDLNIEEIMKLEPDVILYNAGNTAHAEILQESGIPCIGFATVGHETEADPLNRYKQWLDLLEDVFGEEGKTDAFTAAGDEIVADVSSIKAVQDGRVYDTTLGMWNWFTPNPDAPLVFAWLACNTYPEVFADYPLEDTIREYYHDWYGYDVTDEEMEEMLQY